MSQGKRVPAIVSVQCRSCYHIGRFAMPADEHRKRDEHGFLLRPRLRCSECGSTDAEITTYGRESLEAWSRRRRAR